MQSTKALLEYIGKALLILCGRLVEWTVCLALALLLTAAAYWLYMAAQR